MLRRCLLALVSLSLAVLVVAGAALSQSQAAPTLHATVGPGFKISLMVNGKPVKSLKAGTYSFAVSDRAAIHNFVLEKKRGGTFEKELTSVPFTGTKTVKVNLSAGVWEFYCRPHEPTMNGDFTVK